ncbi:MAG TPA: hypothetical protein PLP17_17175, partial [Oligoflexia bacterium]|nr:hypothetical protein [Oligoflexia bacterium]
AFAVWASGYKKYARAFSAEKRIAAGMKDLAGGFVKYGRMEAALAEFEQRLAAQADDRRAYYELFGRFFFSLGLIAELYVPFDMLDEEHARITREIDQPGQFPFLHYRLGILLSYMGKLAAALEEFSSCADHLPASKKLALKLERIIEFVKRVMLVVNKSMGIELSSAPVDAWVEAGFADIFQQQAWKKTGASPEEAAAWRSAGFSAVQCKEWRPYGLDRLSVRAWVDQGFTSPKEAARLAKGDLNPVEAKKWLQYFPDAAHDIVQWRKAGFIEPEEAVIWGSLFTFASEAARWRDLGFQPAEVEICLERGIKDPFTAKGQQQAEQLAAVREDEELE